MPEWLLMSSDQSPACNRKKDLHQVCMHMALKGKRKLIKWFRKSMFVDIHVNESLLASATSQMMLEHLEGTCAKPRRCRQHMAEVQKEFEALCNPKKPVEVHHV